jgi:hypothetical protein
MLDTSIEGTAGVANTEGAGLSQKPDRAINGAGIAISRTLVVAGDAGGDITLHIISPLQLE